MICYVMLCCVVLSFAVLCCVVSCRVSCVVMFLCYISPLTWCSFVEGSRVAEAADCNKDIELPQGQRNGGYFNISNKVFIACDANHTVNGKPFRICNTSSGQWDNKEPLGCKKGWCGNIVMFILLCCS